MLLGAFLWVSATECLSWTPFWTVTITTIPKPKGVTWSDFVPQAGDTWSLLSVQYPTQYPRSSHSFSLQCPPSLSSLSQDSCNVSFLQSRHLTIPKVFSCEVWQSGKSGVVFRIPRAASFIKMWPHALSHHIIWSGSYFKDHQWDLSFVDSEHVLQHHGCALRNGQIKVKPRCARMNEDLEVIMLSGSLERVSLKVKSARIWKLLVRGSAFHSDD